MGQSNRTVTSPPSNPPTSMKWAVWKDSEGKLRCFVCECVRVYVCVCDCVKEREGVCARLCACVCVRVCLLGATATAAVAIDST